MKGRLIVLDRLRGHGIAALVVDGRLEDLRVDPGPEADQLQAGAVLRGVVGRPVKGLGGVFVDLPGGSGFLRQPSGLRPGQTVIVQVTGQAEPGKAVPLSQRVIFKSRHAIVTPGAPGLNISRAIRDEGTRAVLANLAAEAMAQADQTHGLIIRSLAAQTDDDEIIEDIVAMRDLAMTIMADSVGDPELLLAAPQAEDIAWRDWQDPPPDAVERSAGSLGQLGVVEMIDALMQAEVPLGQGSMVIEPTRALVAVDVNTGRDTSPAAGLKVNLAAARDLPRQLRLRGLGGQVTVDFAPMAKRDRGTLEQVLRAAFKGEAAETALAGWTPLGCFELSRKRDRMPLSEALA